MLQGENVSLFLLSLYPNNLVEFLNSHGVEEIICLSDDMRNKFYSMCWWHNIVSENKDDLQYNWTIFFIIIVHVLLGSWKWTYWKEKPQFSRKDTKASKNIWKILQIILPTSVEIWWYFISTVCVERHLRLGLLLWSSLQTKESQSHNEFLFMWFENS